MSDYSNWTTEEGLKLAENTVVETEWIPSVGDFVTVTTAINANTNANELIGKTFQVERVSYHRGAWRYCVTGAKTAYPHLFSFHEGGVYVKELREATKNEMLMFLLKEKEQRIESVNPKQTPNIREPFYETQRLTELYLPQGLNVLNTNISNTRPITEQLIQKKNNFLF